MLKDKIKKTPNQPGIYLFYNSKKELIYVGKATSLKNRIKSYWRQSKNPRLIEEMINEVKNIKWITTDSVLEAIILEGQYIKKQRPLYNIKWRDDKSWNYLIITDNPYPTLTTAREHELKNKTFTEKYLQLFGPYPNLKTTETLRILRKIFNYSTCLPNQKRPCFYYQIGQCLGVCANKITPKKYKTLVINPLILFLTGQKNNLIKKLTQKMNTASKRKNFEEAGRLRDRINRLKKIQDLALLNKNFITEDFKPTKQKIIIEGYDISNLGSTDKVGSLVVFNEFGPLKQQYKKFNIKNVIGQSDVDCLKEVLTRRLQHQDWPLPNYFLIDGGIPQINAVSQILRQTKINLPIIGIAKGPKRKKNVFFLKNFNNLQKKWVEENKSLLIMVRDEAHRFALNFHKSKRKIAR